MAAEARQHAYTICTILVALVLLFSFDLYLYRLRYRQLTDERKREDAEGETRPKEEAGMGGIKTATSIAIVASLVLDR